MSIWLETESLTSPAAGSCHADRGHARQELRVVRQPICRLAIGIPDYQASNAGIAEDLAVRVCLLEVGCDVRSQRQLDLSAIASWFAVVKERGAVER
jgi:hypothetical protein